MQEFTDSQNHRNVGSLASLHVNQSNFPHRLGYPQCQTRSAMPLRLPGYLNDLHLALLTWVLDLTVDLRHEHRFVWWSLDCADPCYHHQTCSAYFSGVQWGCALFGKVPMLLAPLHLQESPHFHSMSNLYCQFWCGNASLVTFLLPALHSGPPKVQSMASDSY